MLLAKLDIKNKLVLTFQDGMNKKNKKTKKKRGKKNQCKKNRFLHHQLNPEESETKMFGSKKQYSIFQDFLNFKDVFGDF